MAACCLIMTGVSPYLLHIALLHGRWAPHRFVAPHEHLSCLRHFFAMKGIFVDLSLSGFAMAATTAKSACTLLHLSLPCIAVLATTAAAVQSPLALCLLACCGYRCRQRVEA